LFSLSLFKFSLFRFPPCLSSFALSHSITV
jgi:hypothetical protein